MACSTVAPRDGILIPGRTLPGLAAAGACGRPITRGKPMGSGSGTARASRRWPVTATEDFR